MTTNYWKDGTDNWTTNPSADWTTGALPTGGDDVVIDQGRPTVNTNVGTVNSVTNVSALDIEDGGTLAASVFANFGILDLTGATGGASLDVTGTLANSGTIQVGSSTLGAPDTVSVSNFVAGVGSLSLDGSATNAATLATAGSTAATFGPTNTLTGTVSLSGDALLQFGSGQITNIFYPGSLTIDGTNAFVADAGSTDSDSALNLQSNAGKLTLDNGASLTTAANFVNYGGTLDYRGTIDLANTNDIAATTTLNAGAASGFGDAGGLSSSISVSGNAQLVFTSGTITAIDYGGSLSIDGTNAFVADVGATGSNSAIGALTGNAYAGLLSLDDGASLTTAANFVNGGAIDLANTKGVATTTTLNAGAASGFEDASGALDSGISVSGNAQLVFTSGTITAIGNGFISSAGDSLSIDGTSAFVSDEGATGSNSAIGALTKNYGLLSLDDGASLTTAANFVNGGTINLANTKGVATTTTLNAGAASGFESLYLPAGTLDGSISVSGNAQLVFTSGQITSIGASDVNGFEFVDSLSIDGTNAFVADAGASGSDSALALASNYGTLSLDDGATLATPGALANGGFDPGAASIELGLKSTTTATTTLDVNSTAGLGTSGVITGNVKLAGNSLLEFASGQITSIGGYRLDSAFGSLSIDGTNAFVADVGATTTNSALDLMSNAGSLSLDNGASLTTAANFVNVGAIDLANTKDVTTTTTLNAGAASGFEDASGALDCGISVSGNAQLVLASGQITGIDDNGGLSLDGADAFVADAGATGSNSALTNLASNAGSLSLADGATLALSGGLANTGYITLDFVPAPNTSYTTPATTVLDVNSAAGLGTAGILTGNVGLTNNSLLEFAQGGQITSIDGSLSIVGPAAFVADAGATGSNSALSGLTSIAGSLTLEDGAAVTTSGALAGASTDSNSISLSNGATLTIGGALSGIGDVSLADAWSVPTVLDVQGDAASFGTMGTVAGLSVTGNSVLEFATGSITGISGELYIDGANALVADAGAPTSNSALAQLATLGAYASMDLLDGAAVTTNGALTGALSSAISLDNGASLKIGGALSGVGNVTLSNDGAAATVLDVHGDASSFENMGVVNNLSVTGDSLLEFASGSIIGVADSLSIDGTSAFVADASAPTSNSALSGLTSNAGALTLQDGATVTTTGTGAFTNTGAIVLGPSSNQPTSTATSVLDLDSSATQFGDANGNLVGSVSLSGNSLLEFQLSGALSGIAGSLSIDGTGAFVADASAPTSNSALSGLTSNAGSLTLADGASVTTTGTFDNTASLKLSNGASLTTMGALANTGTIDLSNTDDAMTARTTLNSGGTAAQFGDANGNLVGSVSLSGNSLLEFQQGGSLAGIAQTGSLSIDGSGTFVADASALTTNSALYGLTSNAGSLSILGGASVTTVGALVNTGAIGLGPSYYDASGNLITSTAKSVLNIGGTAAQFGDANGDLVGSVGLSANSLLEFTSGSLAGIASGGSLYIDGAGAFVADPTNTGANSALTGLTSNAGSLTLDNGASVTTSGPFANTGVLALNDFNPNDGPSPSSTPATIFSIDGTATQFGDASGNLAGTVYLSGNAVLEFASGSLAGISEDGSLVIGGAGAFVADDNAETSNSALVGLSNNAGLLGLYYGASVTTTGTLANTGFLNVDDGASLATMGALTNASTGTIVLSTTFTTNRATLSSGGTAAQFGDANGDLVGTVSLSGNSLLEFASGSLAGIAEDGSLSIYGADAFVADEGATGSNSALSGLTSNAGSLTLADASVTMTGTFDNTGSLEVNGASLTSGALTNSGSLSIFDAASVTTTGVLANASTGSIFVGNSGTVAPTTLTAGSLTNAGTLELQGSTLNASALSLTGGSTTFDGNTTITVSSLTLAGSALLDIQVAESAFTNATPITFTPGAQATVEFDSGALPATGGAFSVPIAGFASGDVIDISSLAFSPGATSATLNGSTLTVTNGTVTDTLTLTSLGATAFTTEQDTYGGTEIAPVAPVCFAAGTLIRAVREGAVRDVSVEALKVGDLAVTASGAWRPIRWLGHRTIDYAAHPHSSEVWPVCIRAGAFGGERPQRDLFLSPGHPVLIDADVDGEDGWLVPIMCLINGTSITRIAVDTVTYWHVELEEHDILLAEGLPAESYIDLGSRPWFAGADGALYDPDLALAGQPGRCRLIAIDGAIVEAERRRLDAVFATQLAGACAWPDGMSLGLIVDAGF